MHAPLAPSTLRSWMSTVGEIARAVNSAQPLDRLLTKVAKQACALIGFDYCAVMLGDRERDRLRVVGWCGLSSDYISLVSDEGSLVIHPEGTRHDSPAARAYREGCTIAVPDVRCTTRYGRLRHLAPAQGYLSLLASPLRVADRVTGLLVGYRERPMQFTTSDVELIELLADQTGVALQTARLREEQSRIIEELSAANAELRCGRMQLEWAERQHHKLMELALEDIGLQGLVDALAEILDASVTVEDADARTLARAPDEGYRPPPVGRRLRPDLHDLDRRCVAVPLPGDREPAWLAPVRIGRETVGRLWTTGLSAAPDPGRRHVIERFALVVGLEILKRRHRMEVQERLSGDLIADLLRPDGLAQPQAVVERAAALGHDITEPHWLGLVVGDPVSWPVTGRNLLARLGSIEPAVLAGVHENHLVVLVPADLDPVRILRKLLGGRGRRGPGIRAVAVICDRTVDPAAVGESYRVACTAAEIRRSAGRTGLVDLRDSGIRSLLIRSGAPTGEYRRFAESLIGPLLRHDERRRTDLVKTVRA